MYLKQLFNAGFAGVTEWRTLWNQTVLPYLRSQRIIAGHGIRTRQMPAGTVIEAVDAGGRGASQGGGAELKIGAVVASPAGGFGTGVAQDIITNSDGTYSVASGGAVMGYVNLYL